MKREKKNPYMFRETNDSKLYVKNSKLAKEIYTKMNVYDKKALSSYSSGDMKKGQEYEAKSDKLYADNYHKMFGVKTKNPFNDKILSEIRHNTDVNNHSENFYQIAKTGKLSTEKDLKKISDDVNTRGYLSERDSKREHKLYKKSLGEIKEKFGQQAHDDIYLRT